MPELDRILIVTHAATEVLNEEEVFVNGNEHVFRMSVPVYQDAILPALIFAEREELTRFATIGADYEYGRTSWEMFQETLSELRPDVEFVAEAWAPFLTNDFSSHLGTVLAAEPDVIFATPWAGEAVALLRQAGGMGAFDQIDVWWQAMGGSVDVLEGITPDLQSGTFQDKLWATGRYLFTHPDTDANQAFVSAFQERWDRFPNYSAATTYAAVYALKQAVESVESLETEDVIGALEGLRLEAPAGEVELRAEDHQAVYAVPAGRVVFSEEFDMACVCEDVEVLDAGEYYRNPPFDDAP
jgi:branched-chain amino acid transport system substrate-binding protein